MENKNEELLSKQRNDRNIGTPKILKQPGCYEVFNKDLSAMMLGNFVDYLTKSRSIVTSNVSDM